MIFLMRVWPDVHRTRQNTRMMVLAIGPARYWTVQLRAERTRQKDSGLPEQAGFREEVKGFDNSCRFMV